MQIVTDPKEIQRLLDAGVVGKIPNFMKLEKAEELLLECQRHINDPDLQNNLDLYFGRTPTHQTVKITLNDKRVDTNKCTVSAAFVRSMLPPEQAYYTMFRETESGPDQHISDGMMIYSGDKIYTIPPCMGA